MLALLCTMLGTAWGGTITFADLGLENGVQYSDPFDGGDFTVTFVGGANDGKYYNTGQGIRVYGNGQMVVEAKSGNLTKVVLTFAPGNDFRPASGDVVDTGTFDPESGTWTGSAPKVTFTRPAGSGHWRVQKVEATVGGGQPMPTISGTTPFTDQTTVTITPSNADFAVYYTIDGSAPGASSTSKTYSGPFTLTATTTVKAVEEDLAGNLSPVAEKTFVKEDAGDFPVAADIAAFNAMEDGTEATLTLNNAQVLFVGTNDVYVRDGSGAIDFYKTGINFVEGQVMNGKITGKSTKYNDIPELAKTDNTNNNGYTSSAGSTVPLLVTIAQAKSETYYCELIKIKGVKVVAKEEGQYTNYYAYIGNDSIQLYDRFQVGMGEWNENDTYDAVGILVPYKGKYEIYITKPLVPGGDTPEEGTVADIAAFKALDANTEATLMLNNAQVVYANGRDVFVRDESGAIEFFNTGIEFETNQMLSGKITGKLSFYQNLPELAKTDNTNANNINFFTDGEAQPKHISIAEANGDKYLCDLVQLDNVTLTLDGSNTFANNNGASIQLYDKWKLLEQQVSPDSYAGNTYNVKGILVIFKTNYQIYPIEVATTEGIKSITADEDANAPAYNLAGQRVDNAYKGVVIKNGKKTIKK